MDGGTGNVEVVNIHKPAHFCNLPIYIASGTIVFLFCYRRTGKFGLFLFYFSCVYIKFENKKYCVNPVALLVDVLLHAHIQDILSFKILSFSVVCQFHALFCFFSSENILFQEINS